MTLNNENEVRNYVAKFGMELKPFTDEELQMKQIQQESMGEDEYSEENPEESNSEEGNSEEPNNMELYNQIQGDIEQRLKEKKDNG